LTFGTGGVGPAGWRVMFAPSTPVLGSGAGPGRPAADGDCVFFRGGCVIAGGAFW